MKEENLLIELVFGSLSDLTLLNATRVFDINKMSSPIIHFQNKSNENFSPNFKSQTQISIPTNKHPITH